MKKIRVLVFWLATVAWATAFAAEPEFNATREFCSTEADGTTVWLRCDENRKVCRVAPVNIRGADNKPTNVLAKLMTRCREPARGLKQEFEQAGYKMVRDQLGAPHGFQRDERNRLFQTHFDLTRRFVLGAGTILAPGILDQPGFEAALRLETLGRYERFDVRENRRNRHRFLTAELRLNPLEFEAEAYAYNRGRTGEKAPIWITTFIGEPRRYDINIHFGPDVVVGRFEHRKFATGAQTLIDVGELGVKWEFWQGTGMEDVLAVRTSVGGGLRHTEERATVYGYAYPVFGVEGFWLLGGRGLTAFSFDASFNWAWEPANDDTVSRIRASTTLERVIIAINDQPLTFFIKPEFRHLDIEEAGVQRSDLRAVAGVRINLFVPPRRDETSCTQLDRKQGRCS